MEATYIVILVEGFHELRWRLVVVGLGEEPLDGRALLCLKWEMKMACEQLQVQLINDSIMYHHTLAIHLSGDRILAFSLKFHIGGFQVSSNKHNSIS